MDLKFTEIHMALYLVLGKYTLYLRHHLKKAKQNAKCQTVHIQKNVINAMVMGRPDAPGAMEEET